MAAYYNEIDPFAAAWLAELMADGLIAVGDVDTRSITEVRPDDVEGYDQVHFFAGIGGWSYALRLAGWPDDRPVWTGSCPCQPFSSAGSRSGADDERHLWPAFYRLIAECRPATVFGEQVASRDGRTWLAAVRSDLESVRYAVGAADLCAAGAGAPHIRQRLYWVAESDSRECDGVTDGEGREHNREKAGWIEGDRLAEFCGASGGMADADGRDAGQERQQRDGEQRQQPQDGGAMRVANGQINGCRQGGANAPGRGEGAGPQGAGGGPADDGGGGRMGDAGASGLSPRQRAEFSGTVGFDQGRTVEQPGGSPWADPGGGAGEPDASAGFKRGDYHRPAPTNPWADLEWLPCADGRTRPTQPGLFPLVDGFPNRVGTLRGAGNAIVPQVAAAFIIAAREAISDLGG